MSGDATFGKMWRPIMRHGPAPIERDASMKVSSRTASTWPRMRRTNPGTNTIAIAMDSLSRLLPSSAATVNARISGGNANIASMTRINKLSVRPPKYPAIRPSGSATANAKPMIMNAASSETWAPYMMRLKMSRPMSSVPSRCDHDGVALICRKLLVWE